MDSTRPTDSLTTNGFIKFLNYRIHLKFEDCFLIMGYTEPQY